MAAGTDKTVTLDQLDYSYISKCDNEKELERILRALRSGREGFYPQLIEHCEKKLESINPQNRGLRKQNRILEPSDLKQDELFDLQNSMNEWQEKMNEMKHQVNGFGDHVDNLPPVRSAHVLKGNQKKEVESEKNEGAKSNRIRSWDYKSWDKYDADKECKEVDEKPSAEKKTVKTKKVSIPKEIDASNLSQEEKHIKATKEKEKGNEAFKSGDFDEALSYYCRSISLLPIAASYNNRALVHLRLEKWKEAKKDCNTVLSMDGESQNLKAMLRRASACKELGEYDLAKTDLLFVLEKEPNNARAKSILKDVNKLEESQQLQKNIQDDQDKAVPVKSGKKMVIQEVEGDSDEADEDAEESTDSKNDCKVKNLSPENNDEDSLVKKADGGKLQDEVPPEHENKIEPIKAPIVPKFPPKTEELKSKAAEFFKTGRYGEAGEYYTEAIESLSTVLNHENPELEHQFASAVLHNNRAACWLKQGNDKACIDDCNTVLNIKKWDVKALMRRATAYEHMEKYVKAWVDYKSAHSVDLTMSLAQDGANRVTTHLKEIYGVRWREKVPPVPRYPHHDSGAFMERNIATTVTTEKFSNVEAVTTKMAPKENLPKELPVVSDKISNSTTKVEDKSVLIPTSDEPKTTTKAPNKSKNRKRNKAKSKSPKKTEQQKEDANIEEKRNKIRREVYEKMKNEGNDLVKKGKYQPAIKLYTKCISVSPKEPASYTNRALCFLKLKKHISAINDCTEAIKIDPVNVKAFYRRSLARKEEGFYKEAERDIKKLLEIDPGNNAATKELEVLKKLAWDAARKKGGNASNNDQPAEPRKKQLVIEEVDSSSSSDEGEFILPVEATTEQKAKETEKIVVLDDKKEIPTPMPSLTKQKDLTEITTQKSEAVTAATVEPKKETPVETSSPTKQQSMMGAILDPTPGNNKPLQKLNNRGPITPFEFGAQWGSVSDKQNINAYKAILDRVSPENLPSVLSNKIDDHIISIVAQVSLDHIKAEGNIERAFGLMKYLTKAKRFQMAAMFMSDEDQKALRATFEALSSHGNKTNIYTLNDLDDLLKAYNL